MLSIPWAAELGLPANLEEKCEPEICPLGEHAKRRDLANTVLIGIHNRNTKIRMDAFAWMEAGKYNASKYQNGEIYGYQYRMREMCAEQPDGELQCRALDLILKREGAVPPVIECGDIYRGPQTHCYFLMEWHERTLEILVRRHHLHEASRITDAVIRYLEPRTVGKNLVVSKTKNQPTPQQLQRMRELQEKLSTEK